MGIEAKVILDSVSEDMIRLPTILARFPRFILPEVLTHRVFSRNTASSRAIPVTKIIADIYNDTAMPLHWGRNQPGMSANGENSELIFLKAYRETLGNIGVNHNLYHAVVEGFSGPDAWLYARDKAIEVAQAFNESKYHKQIVNRIVEPFVHTNMIITSTYWQNFFKLRMAEDAQPEMQVLSEQIYHAQLRSKPTLLRFGQWHLPYVSAQEKTKSLETLRCYSSARIARVSYNNHDGSEPSHDKDMATYEKLIKGGSLHGSCFEHVATPVRNHRASNFNGWMQFREVLDNLNPYNETYEGEYIDYDRAA